MYTNSEGIAFEIRYGNLMIVASIPFGDLPQGWEKMSGEERREALDWGDFKFKFLGFDGGHEDFKKKVYDKVSATD